MSGDFAVVDFKTSGHDELMPLVEHLGLQGVKNPRSLTLRRGDFEVTVGLEIDSGAVTGFSAASAWRQDGGGAFLTLRRETALDKADKQSGLAVELQLRSPAFDERVFIDTDATDDDVRRMLAPGSRREVAQELVGLCDALTFERGGLLLKFGRPKRGDDRGPRMARALELMQRAWGIGPVPGAALPRRGDGLMTPVVVAAIGSGLAFWFVATNFSVGFGRGLLLLLALFVTGGVVAWPLARRLVAGHSGSGSAARLLVPLFCTIASFGGASVLLGLNAMLGDGGVVEQRGRVVSVGSWDSEDGTWKTRVEWSDGSTSVHHFKRESNKGAPARRQVHPGLLLPWGEVAGLESEASER